MEVVHEKGELRWCRGEGIRLSEMELEAICGRAHNLGRESERRVTSTQSCCMEIGRASCRERVCLYV